MKIRFLRHAVSEGLDNLVQALRELGHDVKKLNIEGSKYRGFPTHLLINWGSSDRRTIRETLPILNDPSKIHNASNKKNCLSILKEAGLGAFIVPFTTNKEEAQMWISQGFSVYGRSILHGTQGEGIIIFNSENPGITDLPLYTKGVMVKREVRTHVFKGEVIDFSQKKRVGKAKREELGIELVREIRNTKNGWVFARDGVTIDDKTKEVSVKAIEALGLDFGAIDIIISDGDVPKILEVNTAPGMEGMTVVSYANAINKLN